MTAFFVCCAAATTAVTTGAIWYAASVGNVAGAFAVAAQAVVVFAVIALAWGETTR